MSRRNILYYENSHLTHSNMQCQCLWSKFIKLFGIAYATTTKKSKFTPFRIRFALFADTIYFCRDKIELSTIDKYSLSAHEKFCQMWKYFIFAANLQDKNGKPQILSIEEKKRSFALWSETPAFAQISSCNNR